MWMRIIIFLFVVVVTGLYDLVIVEGMKVSHPQRAPSSHHKLNERTYTEFTFNGEFNTTKKDEVHESIYSTYSKVLKYFARKSDEGMLTKAEMRLWQPVLNAMYAAFEEERGVVVYDSDIGAWLFCGWIDMSRTFVPVRGKYMRLCLPVTSCGLSSIARQPKQYHDYVPQDSIRSLRKQAYEMYRPGEIDESENNKDEDSILDFSMDDGLRTSSYMTLPKTHVKQTDYDESSATYIDLWAMSTDTYTSTCKLTHAPFWAFSFEKTTFPDLEGQFHDARN